MKVKGKKKFVGSGPKLEGMEDDHTGSQGSKQNVVLENKNKKNINKTYLNESNCSRTHYS